MTESMPRVGISVINWNRPDLTLSCLASLARLDYPNYRIIVVDNASRDDSVERIQASYPDVEVIRSSTNLGFAGGHRLAKDLALKDNADLLWMLNNDAVANESTLTELVAAYQRMGDGIFGSMTLVPDDPTTIAFGGGQELDEHGNRIYSLPYNYLDGQPYDPTLPDRQIEDVNGSSFMVPLSVVRQYGFMDESFFLYGEETDYCYRLKQNGIPAIMVTKSTIVHLKRASTAGSPRLLALRAYYRARNDLYLLKRHFPAFYRKELRHRIRTRYVAWLRSVFLPGHRRRVSLDYHRFLGVRDAVLNRTGKTLDPDDFLDG